MQITRKQLVSWQQRQLRQNRSLRISNTLPETNLTHWASTYSISSRSHTYDSLSSGAALGRLGLTASFVCTVDLVARGEQLVGFDRGSSLQA